jgi:ribonuclease Z
LTHAHGDHTFGLPGLLCLMGQDRGGGSDNDTDSYRGKAQPQPPKVIEIYGPEGLRKWLRVAIRFSVSRIVPPYRVHELKDIPMAPEWTLSKRHQRFYHNRGRDEGGGRAGSGGVWCIPPSNFDDSSWVANQNRVELEPTPLYGEIDGGRDIYPNYNHPFCSDGAPIWQVEDEGDVKVYAAPMSHGIPCVGYMVKEEDRPGRLRDDLVRPICERNFDALKDAGFMHPLKAMQVIKDLPMGSSFTFPDGTVVSQEDAVEPPRPGRKVVICGDTASARAMEKMAQGADVVVHEATNTCEYAIEI